ncbi:MAG: tRNA 2-thiouridine(34) synthase MnmA [Candidatus Colwellbacteria bacterium]|nr:tRNA 2-thiouridine(34) synthase MnmA [Candidatus Colwellbacteria bacterium]
MLKGLRKPKARPAGASAKRVFVGLSGGVDSSVTAYLLKKRGFEVTGIHLRCWNRLGCDVKEAEDARLVAEHLGIPFYVFDLEEEYKKRVVDYMIHGYSSGITPNPDVMCNKEIKFGLFLQKALEMGSDYIATGHYVRLVERKKKFSLLQAKDKNKDQSYFLWTLTQEQLKHCLFPIGAYLKSDVRNIARKAGIPTADKKDSQGICFLGKVTIREFLGEYLQENTGKVLTTAGAEVGIHKGIQFYTVGQRHGLGISGAEPYYIAKKVLETNTLVVSSSKDDSSLYKKDIEITSLNWIAGVAPQLPLKVLARVRYRQPLSEAVISRSRSNNERIVFKVPQKFVASGQSAVFYSRLGKMLGGGIIK